MFFRWITFHISSQWESSVIASQRRVIWPLTTHNFILEKRRWSWGQDQGTLMKKAKLMK